MNNFPMKRWSKLQKELYKIIAPCVNFQIHCVAYQQRHTRGRHQLPRYWISIDHEIVWDYPCDFLDRIVPIAWTCASNSGETQLRHCYPYELNGWQCAVSSISDLLRQYIDTPADEVFDKDFANDQWGLTMILKACDRRIGKRRLQILMERALTGDGAFRSVAKIIDVRINAKSCKNT
jgi:hypothetical protein